MGGTIDRIGNGELTEKLLQQHKSPINDVGHSEKIASDARTQTESARTGNASYDLESRPVRPQDIAAERTPQTPQAL